MCIRDFPDTQPPTTHATTGHGQPAIRPAGYPNHPAGHGHGHGHGDGHGHGPATATHEKEQSSMTLEILEKRNCF
jgi:hypothetical protein